MKISIIMPVFNVKKYLKRAIESVLSQDYEDYELILIDDGSKDGSCSICDEYRFEENVIVIHKKNGGLDSARNAGLKAMSGDLFTFIDSDDYIEPGYFSRIDSVFKEHPDIDLVVFEWNNVYEATQLIERQELTEFGYVQREVMIHNIISFEFINGGGFTWNKVWRKNNYIPLFDENQWCFEDKLWNLIMLQKCHKIWIQKSAYYNYIIRQGSLSHDNSKEEERKINAINTYKKIEKIDYNDKKITSFAKKAKNSLVILYLYDSVKLKQLKACNFLYKEKLSFSIINYHKYEVIIKCLILYLIKPFRHLGRIEA